VYSFMFSLIGIRVDYFLSIFDLFRFNLPSWTYNKLFDLHLNWLNWLKSTAKISSITSDFENTQISQVNDTTVNTDKPDKYFYLTKKQWLYAISSIFTVTLCYFLGLYYNQSIDWESDSDNENVDPKAEGAFEGKSLNFPIRTKEDKTWQDTFYDYSSKITDKIINVFNWILRRSDRRGNSNPSLEDSKDDYNKWIKQLESEKGISPRGIKLRDNTTKPTGNNSTSSSKNSSPTHDDPEVESEREHFFPSPKSRLGVTNPWGSSSSPSSPPSPLYQSGSNDSTDTVTQDSVWTSQKKDLPKLARGKIEPLTQEYDNKDLKDSNSPIWGKLKFSSFFNDSFERSTKDIERFNQSNDWD
jgi:hypothetical protein